MESKPKSGKLEKVSIGPFTNQIIECMAHEWAMQFAHHWVSLVMAQGPPRGGPAKPINRGFWLTKPQAASKKTRSDFLSL